MTCDRCGRAIPPPGNCKRCAACRALPSRYSTADRPETQAEALARVLRERDAAIGIASRAIRLLDTCAKAQGLEDLTGYCAEMSRDLRLIDSGGA